jgi:hypothetical protein
MRQERKHVGDGETERGVGKEMLRYRKSKKKTLRQEEKQEEDAETGRKAGRRRGDRKSSMKMQDGTDGTIMRGEEGVK